MIVRRRIGCDELGAPLTGQIDEERRFHTRFRAEPADIDELGHVNNAIWMVWIQDISVAHWFAAGRPGDASGFVAVVLRHEIDYRANIAAEDEVAAVTWVDGRPRGARYTRRVDFADANGRIIVAARSQWALVDRQSGRPVRVSPDVVAPFLHDDTDRVADVQAS
ncbi:acyl-CoA thioesterase [Phyllobacterium sp. K27]